MTFPPHLVAYDPMAGDDRAAWAVSGTATASTQVRPGASLTDVRRPFEIQACRVGGARHPATA